MKKDSVINEYVKQNEVFADVVNVALYQGKHVVKAEDLMESDPIYPNYRRDILKECVIKEDEQISYVILGIENQSEMDPTMPIRVMEYDAAEYRKQIRMEKKRQNRNQLQGGEFISGVKKEIKLKPIVTIVFYNKGEEWEGARSLREMMGSEIKEGFNDYKLNLIEPRRLREEEIEGCESGMREILMILKYSGKKEEMIEYLQREGNREIDEETAGVIEAVTKIPMRIEGKEEKINMCKAMEEYTRECKEIGRLEGKKAGQQEEKVKTATKMISDGFSDEMICKYVELSVHMIQELRRQKFVKG